MFHGLFENVIDGQTNQGDRFDANSGCDERFGQRVAAVVQLRPDADEPAVDDLREHARQRIAGYKVPRQIEFCESF